MVDLTEDDFGAPMFKNLRTGGAPGTLTIHQENNVFGFPVSISVGMGRHPGCAILASTQNL